MVDQQERVYFAAREQACRAMAARARDPQISAIHAQLADAYADKLRLSSHRSR